MTTPMIPAGAAVRCKKTKVLGQTFRNPDGHIRGHIYVQWDGTKDRRTVALADVEYVAKRYETAKGWAEIEAGGECRRG